MKISTKQYALALYEIIDEGKKENIANSIKDFVKYLSDNNLLSRANDILEEFNKVWNEKKMIMEASVISSRQLDDTTRNSLLDYVREKTQSKEVVLNENIDKKILGGFILKYSDKIIDSSIKGRIESLNRSLSD